MSRLISSESSHLRMGLIEGRNHVLFYTSGYFDLKDEHGFVVSQAYQLEVLTAFIRQFTGVDWMPSRLGICGSSAPAVVGEHFPDCRIRLEQPFSYIVISRSRLHLGAVAGRDAHPDSTLPLLTADLDHAETLDLLIRPYLPEGYLPIRFAASLAGTSVRTLSRRLSKCGTSYQSLIDGMRFKLATDLLLESDASISNIGEASGFQDKANFARMFRRVGGLSPREFRKAQGET
jgi:AraC-like DNA-binding protein